MQRLATIPTTIFIHNKTYSVHDVPADGNCFFHCLSYIIHGNFFHTDYYRQLVCSFILSDWPTWRYTAQMFHDSSTYRCEYSYRQKMILRPGWATACEIQAASKILQCNINVWLKDIKTGKCSLQTMYTPENDPGTANMAIDVLLEGSHFKALLNKKTAPTLVQCNSHSQQHMNHSQSHSSSDLATGSFTSVLSQFSVSTATPALSQSQSEVTQNYALQNAQASDFTTVPTQLSVSLDATQALSTSQSEATQNYALQNGLEFSDFTTEPSQISVSQVAAQALSQSQSEATQNYALQYARNIAMDHGYANSISVQEFQQTEFNTSEPNELSTSESTRIYTVQSGQQTVTALTDHDYSRSNSHLQKQPISSLQMPAYSFSNGAKQALADHEYAVLCDKFQSEIHDDLCEQQLHTPDIMHNVDIHCFNNSVADQASDNLPISNNEISRKRPSTRNVLGTNKVQCQAQDIAHVQHPSSIEFNDRQECVSNAAMGHIPSHQTTEHTTHQSQHTTMQNAQHSPTQSICRRFGITYENKPVYPETTQQTRNRRRRNVTRIQRMKQSLSVSEDDVPQAPPLSSNASFNTAMDAIRTFEIKQMSYSIKHCIICHERRIEMKMSKAVDICKRCFSDRLPVKMFSAGNNMDPGLLPPEMRDLTVVEQQLISRISPCISIHMLKHGGIASSGHCVTFPQEIGEPASIFPRLPSEIEIIRVRKQGRNDTSKEFRVRRYKVQSALLFLQNNNPAYSNITISAERLQTLPLDGELQNIATMEYRPDTVHQNDVGPAPQQTETGNIDGETHSSVLLPEPTVNIRQQVETVVKNVIGGDHGDVTVNRLGTITIPWPSRSDVPVSEYTTQYFFTMSFPALFPYATADYFANRMHTCCSMSDWADHLLWYEDARFASHQYFKFVVHNMIMRKRATENSTFIVNQKLGDGHLTISDLKEKAQQGDKSTAEKILYFAATLRGTSQYWAQRARELRALIQFKINEGSGLPSFFTTGSCAEFHFKPLRRLLAMYVQQTTGHTVDLQDRNTLFHTLQKYAHIVAQYFDMRTKSYFEDVMSPVFSVNTFWVRQEFAKSRGMIHFHGLCWRSDKQPHSLIHDAVTAGLSDELCAEKLAAWADSEFGMTACHPGGTDEHGQPRKEFWPPPEGHAPLPADDNNPLVKLLMDVSSSQQTLLEDYLLLSNRVCLHRCSDYCLTKPSQSRKAGQQEKICRMEFPKQIRSEPAMVKDRHGSLRLEMARDHPVLVQNSRFHTQGWRANGDISLILSKSDPQNPAVNEILATEKYITGYACKGNQSTGAIADLFNDMVNCADESTGATGKSLCTKLLMGTVKRDISAVEAAYDLSSLPLYRCSHTFQSVSLSGSRVMEQRGSTLTKNTPLDKYLGRDPQDTSSFYQYICKSGNVPVISSSATQASWPLDDNYCRTMLLLHRPNWRAISDIKDEDCAWTDIMTDFLLSNDCPNFIKAQVERAKEHECQHDHEDDMSDAGSDQQDNVDQPEWMDLMIPNPNFDAICSDDYHFDDGGLDYDWSNTTYEYPQDMGKNWMKTITAASQDDTDVLQIPTVDVTQLNEEQLFAFNIVMHKLEEFNQTDVQYEPLRMIVSGTAGTGKSFLIKCLVKAIRTSFQSNKAVQVLCPTGNSANLISGVTLHSFLKVPTYQKGAELTPPKGSIGLALQSNCTDVKVLLVDERSLIGANTLGWMEFLCKCGTNDSTLDSSWGGFPVVVFLGDDVQLPPVLDSPVYNCSSKCPASIHGVLVWQQFNTAVTLSTIVRQNQDEQQLRNVLWALRQYKITTEQVKWLQQFQWDNLKVAKGEQLMHRLSHEGLFVFPTNQEVWKHNRSKLIEANKLSPVAKISAETRGPHAKALESDKSGGLLSTLFLCKNAKVMLTVNLCVPYGLFNGAVGKVVDIVYLHGNKPVDALPDVVMVEIPTYSGPAFLQENPKLVPLGPVQRKVDCRCSFCTRKQIPLRLGWATTVHRCQGMTIGCGEPNRYIIIHPGTRSYESRNPGALFVALSRAKSTGLNNTDPDFAWHPSVMLNEDRLRLVVDTKTTKARAFEIARIAQLSQQTKQKFNFLHGSRHFLQRYESNVNPEE